MNTTKPVSKQGRHGTLHLYTVEYGCDEEFTSTVRLWAYSQEHAEERFLDTDEGFDLRSIKPVRADR